MLSNKTPQLIIFLGSIGSGKSYFARQLAPRINAVRINSDAMRLAMFGSLEELIRQNGFNPEMNKKLFGALDYSVAEILRAGVSVVYDVARFNRREYRAELETLAKEFGIEPLLVWIDTPREVAIKRVQERKETNDQRQMDIETASEIIDDHEKGFNPPLEHEHFIKIDGTLSFEGQYAIFAEYLER